MDRLEISEACTILHRKILNVGINQTNNECDDALQALQTAASTSSEADFGNAIFKLTRCADAISKDQHDKIQRTSFFAVLADATRNHTVLRSWFGVTSGQDLTVLDVVSSMINESKTEDNVQSEDELIRHGLRLIANCCANNAGNRKYFLDRSYMSCLVNLLERGMELDTLVPTIYNVCNGDLEQASFVPQVASDNITGEVEEPTMLHVSRSAECLAGVRREHAESSTFELLLHIGATSFKDNADRRGFLAELLEIAATPAVYGLEHICRARQWTWKFMVRDTPTPISTLDQAIKFSTCDGECHLHVMRAIICFMSQSAAREELLRSTSDDIWALTRLFDASFTYSSHDRDVVSGAEEDEEDDCEVDIKECRKQFMRLFYELTSSQILLQNSELCRALRADATSMLTRSRNINSSAHSQSHLQPNSYIATALIVLAQLSATEATRNELALDAGLHHALISVFEHAESPDILYPALALTSRIAASVEPPNVFSNIMTLQALIRPLNKSGLGLAVPYETVMLITQLSKGRSDLFFDMMDSTPDHSIHNNLIKLFDSAIELGTKSEIGLFFIETLRATFPQSKILEDPQTDVSSSPQLAAFDQFLKSFGKKITEIFAFICTKVEPIPHRVHGWFGLGMLSVWEQGRRGIIETLQQDQELRQTMSNVSQSTEDGPASSNLKLMLSKMQACSKHEISGDVKQQLEMAGHNLGIELKFG